MTRFCTLLFLSLSLSINVNLKAQEGIQTETETHIFWQSDRVLSPNDFGGDGTSNPKFIKYCDELDLCTMAYVGLFAVLDIPKKKSQRGKLIEKAYFAPAFDKSESFILKFDSTGIFKQKVVFDIYEASARFARQQLKQFQDSMPGYGTLTIMFKSVEVRALEMRNSLVNSFTQDVYIQKRDGAYEEWRKRVDILLEDLKDFATQPEDCSRFVKNVPLEENYIMADKVVGNLY